MSEKLDLFHCKICGQIVQVMNSGIGELVCCNKPMTKLIPKANDEGLIEKHVPIYKDQKIMVGSVPHPMTTEHHIEFIQGYSQDKKQVYTKFLDYNDEPCANPQKNEIFEMREYCNLHGLWQGKNE